MSTSYRFFSARRLAAFALGVCGLSTLGFGQMAFSIGQPSASVGVPDSFGGAPITAGDILRPFTGVPAIGRRAE